MPSTRDPSEYVRSAVRAMRGYTPGEQRAGCLKLNTNESPWPPSPRVAEAVAHEVDRLPVYPDPLATPLLEAASRRYGVPPECIIAGNGSDDCLTMLFRAHLEPGDAVACPSPTYGLYGTLAEIQGAELRPVPYRSDWGLPDLAVVGARLTLVVQPNNPSGTIAPSDVVRALAERTDGVVVVDEAYVDFAGDGASLLPYLAEHPNLVVLRSFSKSFGLAGVRLGLLFAHPSLVTEYRKVKDSYNVDRLALRAGVAALDDVAHHAEMVRRVTSERARLGRMLTDRYGWSFPEPRANFLLCRVGPSAEHVYRALADRDILVRFWPKPELREHLRITVGRPADSDRLVAALDVII